MKLTCLILGLRVEMKRNITPIGFKLMRYRLLNELTLQNVADLIGKNVSTVQRIERGFIRNPHALTVHKLYKYLPGFADNSDCGKYAGTDSTN